MPTTTLRFTAVDDGLEVADDEFATAEFERPWRYERIDGKLHVMAPAGHDHQASSEPFRDALVVYKLNHPDIVENVFEEAWIAVDEQTDRICDIGVYLHGRDGRIPQRRPDVVFEFVSPSAQDRRRDLDEKRRDYERAGVTEYVVVDRFNHSLSAFRLSADGYEATLLTADDTYTSPLLPGLEIELAGLV